MPKEVCEISPDRAGSAMTDFLQQIESDRRLRQ